MTPLVSACDKLLPSTSLLQPAYIRAKPPQLKWSTEEDSSVQESMVSWDTLQCDLTWLAEHTLQSTPMQDAARPQAEAGRSTIQPPRLELPALDDLLPPQDPGSFDDGSTFLDASEDFPRAMMDMLGLPELSSLDPAAPLQPLDAAAMLCADLDTPKSSTSSCNPVALSPIGARPSSSAPSQQLQLAFDPPPLHVHQQLQLQTDNLLDSRVLSVPGRGKQPQCPGSLFALPPSLSASPYASRVSMQSETCLQQPHAYPTSFMQARPGAPPPPACDTSAVGPSCSDVSLTPRPISAPLTQRLASRTGSFQVEPTNCAGPQASPVRLLRNSSLSLMHAEQGASARLSSFGTGLPALPNPHASPACPAAFLSNICSEPTQLAVVDHAVPGGQSFTTSSPSNLRGWDADCQHPHPQQLAGQRSASGMFNVQFPSLNPDSIQAQLPAHARVQSPHPSSIGSDDHDLGAYATDPYPTPNVNDWRGLRARLWGDEQCTPEAMVGLEDEPELAGPSVSDQTPLPVPQSGLNLHAHSTHSARPHQGLNLAQPIPRQPPHVQQPMQPALSNAASVGAILGSPSPDQQRMIGWHEPHSSQTGSDAPLAGRLWMPDQEPSKLLAPSPSGVLSTGPQPSAPRSFNTAAAAERAAPMCYRVPSLLSDAGALHPATSLGSQRHSWGPDASPSRPRASPMQPWRSAPSTPVASQRPAGKSRAHAQAPRIYTSTSLGQLWQKPDGDVLSMDLDPPSPPADMQLPFSRNVGVIMQADLAAWDCPPAQPSSRLPASNRRARSHEHDIKPSAERLCETLTSLQQQPASMPHPVYAASTPVAGHHADIPTPLTSRDDSVEHQLLAWSAEGVHFPGDPAQQHGMCLEAQPQAIWDSTPLQEVPTWGSSPDSSIEMACTVPSRSEGVLKRRRRTDEPVADEAPKDGLVGGQKAEPTEKRSLKAVAHVKQGRGSVSAAFVGQSKASQQLKALEQINLVFQKDKSLGARGNAMPDLPFPRPKRQKAQVLAPGARTQQLALEKNVEKLIDEVYTLGVKGVSLPERQAATKQTIQAIQDACALCSRPGSQAHFVPHPEVSRVAAECKLDAQGMVEGALHCRCHKPLRVSHGPLKGVTASNELLQAPETAYQDTETAYVCALASVLTAARSGAAAVRSEGPAMRLAVELSLLFVQRCHLRRSSAIAAQHEGLTRLQSHAGLRNFISDDVWDKIALTEAQIQELVVVRDNYMTRTRRVLQQRQALWQMVRANLLDTSLQDGCPSAESKICAFEKVLELQRNMDDYHWNFAWLMREWCLRILIPSQVAIILASFESPSSNICQVMACAGIFLLETLALRADSDPAPELLAALEIPSPQDFSRRPTSVAG